VPPTPLQQARVERVERLIGLASPVLDLILATGERVSRLLGPEDEYYPIRSAGEALPLSPPDRGESPEPAGDEAGSGA
jgi:hypothetical protein